MAVFRARCAHCFQIRKRMADLRMDKGKASKAGSHTVWGNGVLCLGGASPGCALLSNQAARNHSMHTGRPCRSPYNHQSWRLFVHNRGKGSEAGNDRIRTSPPRPSRLPPPSPTQTWLRHILMLICVGLSLVRLASRL